MIDVTLDGKPYQEMHVDGGAFAQTFLYPSALTREPRAAQAQRPVGASPARAYVIRNGRLDPEWATVRAPHARHRRPRHRHHDHLSGYNDVIRIYNITQRDGIDYNLAFIGSRLHRGAARAFDSGLHARAVRLRLPACAPRLRLGEEAADRLILFSPMAKATDRDMRGR